MFLRKLLISSFKPIFAGFLLITLTQCGFKPLYIHDHTVLSEHYMNDLGLIELGPLPNREGQILRNAILDHIQPYAHKHKTFFLKMNLSIDETSLGTKKDQTIARKFVTILLEYQLIRRDDGHVFAQNTIRQESQYQADLSGFFTRTIREKTIENILLQIRETLLHNLVIAFREAR